MTIGAHALDAPRATGRTPSPVDVRLLPAAVVACACALSVPLLPFSAAQLLSVTVAAAAAVTTLCALWTHRRPPADRCRRGTVWAVLAVAFWFGAVVSVQAVAERQESRALGWEQQVAAQATVRVSGSVAGPAVHSPGTFADRWFVPVDVARFGHPLAPAPSGAAVQVAGGEAWSAASLGSSVCFVAELQSSGSTVFARARTAPEAGSCPADAPGSDGGLDGREQLRSGLRTLSESSVGMAPQLLPGLILGDRSAQSPELDIAMKDSGLSHLSAVSGANCTLIAGAVTMALRSLRARRSVVLAAVLGTLAVFVIVVGLEPSVIRAAVMGGIGAAALFFGRGRQAFPLLCVAVCVLLCWQPTLATEPAFQLSVCATAGIVLGGRPVEQWLTAVLSRVLPSSVAGIISVALAVTVCAQVACQPVLLRLSGSLSAYAVPANLLAAPLVPFVTVPGTVAAAVVPALPGLSAVILWCVGWPAAGIGWIATTVAGWPGALHPWPEGLLGVGLTALHVVAALALLWMVLRWERIRPARVHRWGARPEQTTSRRVRWGTRMSWLAVCAAIGSQVAVMVPPPSGPIPADWSLAACDVGQGDQLVLRTGQASALVVDTGPDPAAAGRCLRDLGVKQVDLLVLSHLHQDHVGGTEALMDCCAPQHIIYSTATHPVGATGEKTSASIAPPDAVLAHPGDRGQIGSDGWRVEWTVLAADHGASSENDASLVMLAVVTTDQGQFSVLLTGDLEQQAAARLARSGALPEAVDVLKVSHHGARNGGLETAQAVQPRLSVISVGADNDYGHPHEQITGALQRRGPVVRTDQHGTAVLSLRDGALVPTVRAPHRTGGGGG